MLQISGFKQFMIWATVLIGLLLAMPNGFYGRVEQHNDAVALVEQGQLSPEIEEDVASWPSFLPSGLVNLGLDLRGGAHLLAEVQTSDVYATLMEASWPEVRDALAAERDTVGFVTREDGPEDLLIVRISNPEGADRALEIIRGLARPVQTLTGVGATDIEVTANGPVFTIQLSEAERQAVDERTMQQSLEIIRNRIDEVGTREPTIQRQGTNRILVQVPGVGSAQEVKDIIGTTAQLSFRPVVGRTDDAAASPGSGNVLLPSVDEPGLFYILERSPVVTGEQLVDAQPAFDQNGRPAVNFRFNVTGARQFGDYTAENVGSPFAIVLDDEVISAPTIQSHIPGGSGIITGNFSVEESTNLAVLLRAGALPAELTFLEERTIGPELGQDSIDAGQIACIVAGIAVLIYMFLSYGLFGVFANIGLIINVGLIFGLLSLIGATLTLPGIAGIVLTIGMAVDANVIVFERIREELKTAKGPARAIELGYEKALSSILDANITTFMTASILFIMGSGPVRGFAITLGLGILTSVFTALFVTRAIIVLWYGRKRPKTIMDGPRLKMIKDETKFDFFNRAKMWLGISGIAMLIAFGSFAYQGLNFGIDFQGGTSIRTQSEQPVDVGAYRDAIEPLELGDVSISEVFDPTFDADQNVAMVRIQAQDGDESVSADTIAAVEAALQSIDPSITFPSVESVGPKVSGELIQTAIIAVALAVIGIMAYIWLRFEWQFAVGAVLALVHDVLLTIGIFSELQIKFDLAIIAALLTIVGYSINDTVIVFDRVRENLRKYKQKSLKDVLNLSINETLSRTLMTSGTTMLALLALFILGGDVIRGFVFAMMWGVFIGTYSSIFVATAVLLVLGVKRDWTKKAPTVGNQYSNIDA
ncbi:protein translocase subunit SecD [Yoonia sp. 208BN28-4]|uniref:protein translocase subunit SecD n=1 Tax=Yoonia sp. 208BN28-4 TaxID=3126505 RepID=UPI003096DEAB